MEKLDEFLVTEAGMLLYLDQLLPGEDGNNPRMKLLVLQAGEEMDSKVTRLRGRVVAAIAFVNFSLARN